MHRHTDASARYPGQPKEQTANQLPVSCQGACWSQEILLPGSEWWNSDNAKGSPYHSPSAAGKGFETVRESPARAQLRRPPVEALSSMHFETALARGCHRASPGASARGTCETR